MAKPLKLYAIGWAWPHVDHAFGAERGLSRGETVVAVNRAVMAFSPLTSLINAKLAREKPVLDPEIGWALSEISMFEGAGLALVPVEKGKPWQIVSRHFLDPLSLLDGPHDREGVGKLAIRIAADFSENMKTYEKMGFISGFPMALFDKAIADFEERGFTLSSETPARPIDGTVLKARFRVAASTGETVVTLVLVKGRSEVFECPVRHLLAGQIDATSLRTEIALDGDAFVVRGMMPDTVEAPVRIALDDLPPEVRAAL